MSELVSYKDVEESYEGELIHDLAWVDKKLEEAQNILFAACPNAAVIAESLDHPKRGLLRDILVRAVLRVVRDGSPGLKSETLGNYEYSKDALSSSSNLWFPDQELSLLGCGPGARWVGSAKVSTDPVFSAPARVARGCWW